jgi:CelD/BcsL family acetyltransferase involved in cellulose biosynthesis
MLTVTEVNELAELDSLRATWQGLLRQTPDFSFFQTLEWLETAWPHYPLPQKLRVMVVERGGAPLGIVPLCVRTERRRVGQLRVLTYPLNDWGTFYGPIGPDPALAFRVAIERIAATPRDWDFIDLRWIDQASPDLMSIGESLRAVGFDFTCRPRMEVRLVRMQEGWDAYVQTRSRNWRQKMRKDTDALEKKAGRVALVRYRPSTGQGTEREHDAIYDICASIAKNSWQSAAESQSTLSSPRVRDLLRELHRQAAVLGMLDTNILTVADRPVAFNYNYLAENRTYGLRSGFDQTAGLENCGKILIYKMLEDAFQRGDAEYSFGPGRQPHKDRFATDMRYAYTFRHFARWSMRSQLMNLRERVSSRLLSETVFLEKGLVS